VILFELTVVRDVQRLLGVYVPHCRGVGDRVVSIEIFCRSMFKCSHWILVGAKRGFSPLTYSSCSSKISTTVLGRVYRPFLGRLE